MDFTVCFLNIFIKFHLTFFNSVSFQSYLCSNVFVSLLDRTNDTVGSTSSIPSLNSFFHTVSVNVCVSKCTLVFTSALQYSTHNSYGAACCCASTTVCTHVIFLVSMAQTNILL